VTVPRPELVRYRGAVWCHVPADERLDLSRLAEADSPDDRWNERGEATIYLALDRSVALAEFARHADSPGRRRLLRFSVDLDGLADLRRIRLDYADRSVTRQVAAVLRARPECSGLLVPSLAFPDQPERGNLVVFADRIGPPDEWLREPADAGVVDLRD
jgi:RES domain-containing protein